MFKNFKPKNSLESYPLHREMLFRMLETEQRIMKLNDPYGKDINTYKSYMKILLECIRNLYENIDAQPDPHVESKTARNNIMHDG